MLRLIRPKQWAKSAFVLVGPAYGLALKDPRAWPAVLAIVFAFNFASSACYILNDLRDAEQDRLHPRKRKRPIASGEVSASAARRLSAGLFLLSGACVLALFVAPARESAALSVNMDPRVVAGGLGAACVLLYVLNVVLYTVHFKLRPVLDVLSLSMGFVLRVLGGCAAVLVEPSAWLLNCTLFISMFLALGKRLGERRTMGAMAANVRGVQAFYTDDLLRMLVVMTAVACLLSYSDYVQAKALEYTFGFNLLWLTMIPATYAVFRAVLLLERGVYDDPTEVATRDRAFIVSALGFALVTGALMVLKMRGVIGVVQPVLAP
jgi:4-hydroxybenzoate polyprenyltransferase